MLEGGAQPQQELRMLASHLPAQWTPSPISSPHFCTPPFSWPLAQMVALLLFLAGLFFELHGYLCLPSSLEMACSPWLDFHLEPNLTFSCMLQP